MRVFMVFVLAMTAGGALAFGTSTICGGCQPRAVDSDPPGGRRRLRSRHRRRLRAGHPVIDWPANAVPANSISDPKDVIGRGLVLPVIENSRSCR
jgi:hypothetical protein